MKKSGKSLKSTFTRVNKTQYQNGGRSLYSRNSGKCPLKNRYSNQQKFQQFLEFFKLSLLSKLLKKTKFSRQPEIILSKDSVKHRVL